MRCHHALPDRACARLNWLIDWPVVRHAIYSPLLAASSPVTAPIRIARVVNNTSSGGVSALKVKKDEVRPINCTTGGAAIMPIPRASPARISHIMACSPNSLRRFIPRLLSVTSSCCWLLTSIPASIVTK